MRVEVLEPAEAEFREAVEYYNQQAEGLGYEFAAEANALCPESYDSRKLGPRFLRGHVAAAPTVSLME